MKHIVRISKTMPSKGNQAQDAICMLAVIINGIMAATGGSIPFFIYLEEKCDLPVPADTTR